MTESSPTSKSQAIRFAIDTGGTFTDVVVFDERKGTFSLTKTPTTPWDVLEGLLAAIQKANIDLASVTRFFVHGSTTALNALLERKGVTTSYVTTKGFRDIPEIGRLGRSDMYNPRFHKPVQLVPRALRFEVAERINAYGEILEPLQEEDVRSLATDLAARNVRAIAVCLLNSYKNPVHERRVKALFEEVAPGISVTLSCDVAPVRGEYERATTTIVNAYLSPIVERSLDELERTLREKGFQSDIVLTKSDGGGMSAGMAKRAAINTLLSGPAGGLIGGLYVSEVTSSPNVITADVGGTSFDVGLIRHGRATANAQMTAAGFPILIPNLHIRTIGAGCGSIAWLDSVGALHVGPQSAGADPGPICYSKGGDLPTVTDAALVCGYIDPTGFLGGEMEVDAAKAREGISRIISKPLRLSVDAASNGILRIALSHMASAVSDILSESGDDPRDFSLLAFGGGGPLFAAFLLDELRMARAIVPVVPAAFSAWGMLMIDIRHDVVRAIGLPLENLAGSHIRREWQDLEGEAHAVLSRERISQRHRHLIYSADMRYVGQGHTISVPFNCDVPDDDVVKLLHEAFERTYRATFGYTLGTAAEVMNLRISAIGQVPKPLLKAIEEKSGIAVPALSGSRRVIDMISADEAAYAVFVRERLAAGQRIAGPAIIQEPTAVTPVRSGQQCVVDRFGNLILTRAQ